MLIAPERVETETLRVRVLRVFDGDGFLTRIWHPQSHREMEIGVRFGFIDAPEMDQPGGQEAKQFLEDIIADKWLNLSILLKHDTGQIIDRHKRLVCVPYLSEDQTPESQKSPFDLLKALITPWRSGAIMRNIELEMVLNGWAWVVEKYCPDDRYLDALDDARSHRRGIWARSGNIAPWHFKQQQRRRAPPSNIDDRSPDLFSRSNNDSCPKPGCGGQLVRRQGKFGPFVGCSNFPKCRHSQSQ